MRTKIGRLIISVLLLGCVVALISTPRFVERARAEAQTASQNPCGCWINVATGKPAPTVPANGANYGNGSRTSVQISGSRPDEASDPGTNESFVRIPCQPPTNSTVQPPVPLPSPTATPTPAPNPKILWDDPVDLFFGYSYNRAPVEAVKNLNGFNSNFLINVKTEYVERGYSHHANAANPATQRVPKWSIGIDGDLTGAFGSTTTGTAKSTLHRFLYLFGPQFNFFPSQKTRLFVHPLFGVVHDSGTTTVGTFTSSGSASAFAMAFGGGLDIAVNKHFAVRPFQLDYNPTHFGGQWQNSFRFSAGFVLRIKKKH